MGFILSIAAVSSTYFAAAEVIPNKEHHIGLWDICFDTRTYGCEEFTEYLLSIDEDPEWAHACRGLAVTSLLFSGFSILMAVYLAYMASGIHLASLATACINLIAVLLGVIAVCVFTINSVDVLQEQLEMDAYPSWSCAIYVIGLSFYLISALTNIYEICSSD